jgi:hypothetical protein
MFVVSALLLQQQQHQLCVYFGIAVITLGRRHRIDSPHALMAESSCILPGS